jgi:ADP-ribose pyrophosphatase YjhB (NUDIX family)
MRKMGVGIGVMLLKADKILLGLRNPDPKKAESELHGEGTWTMPRGKINFGEKWEDAAYREVFEETGIKIDKKKLEIVCVNDDILPEVHFVTLGLLCKYFEGEPQVKEPEEILEWKWFKLDDLPENIYIPSKKIIESYLSTFSHPALSLRTDKKIVFIGLSKHNFYFRRHAVKFVLEQGCVPISQYGIFDYFLLDTVSRDMIRNANNNLLKISNELWVFGSISDGVLAEIKLAKQLNKPIRYFRIMKSKEIEEISKEDAEFEEGLEVYRDEL